MTTAAAVGADEAEVLGAGLGLDLWRLALHGWEPLVRLGQGDALDGV